MSETFSQFSISGNVATMMSSTDGKDEETPVESISDPSQRDSIENHRFEVDNKRSLCLGGENSPNKKAKRVSSKHVDKQVLHVRRTIQQCCATDDLAAAMDIYKKALEDDIRIEAQSFYNLLSLCGGLGDRGVHVGTPKPREEGGAMPGKGKTKSDVCVTAELPMRIRKEYAFRIKQKMDDRGLHLNETAYSALIRMLSKEHEVDRASELLAEAELVSQCKPRLRLYASLLCAYCELRCMVPALELWARLSKRGLVLTEREYEALMRCAVQVQDAVVMERILSELAEDVLVPSRVTLKSITDWFESPGSVSESDVLLDTASNAIHGVDLPTRDAPSMGPVTCPVSQKWRVSRDCTVDSRAGILMSGCLQGETLQPVTLRPSTWNDMKQMNETIVLHGMLEKDKSEFQGGGKGPKRTTVNKHAMERKQINWESFRSYLKQRSSTSGPIDVVIDGANVGYFKKNFAKAPKHVDYHQIDWVVQHFRQANKNVLLILHERHFAPNLMPNSAAPIVETWKDVLYKANFGMNDDWFWMHAALYSPGALVVTNDEMRDHHFQLLHARSFLRWKERHQVKFSFGDWDDSGKERHAEFAFPDPYSRRIQRLARSGGLVVPLPKRGDERRFLDGSHVANDNEPTDERYVCITAVNLN